MQGIHTVLLALQKQVLPLLPQLTVPVLQQPRQNRPLHLKHLQQVILRLRPMNPQVLHQPPKQRRHQQLTGKPGST